MIINQIAEIPTDEENKDISDVILFMIQCLSTDERPLINFLVRIFHFYNERGYLTDKQRARIYKIFDDFMAAATIQFPDKICPINNFNSEPVKRKNGFMVYEGGKK